VKTYAAAIAILAVAAAGCRTAGEIRVTVRDATGCTVTVTRPNATQDATKATDVARAASIEAAPLP